MARALPVGSGRTPNGGIDATPREMLKRARDIMQSLKEKAELTAEQQRWLKEIEQAE